MDGGLDPIKPCTATIGFRSSEDDNDDLLRFLQFSDPDFPPLPALPAPPIDGIEPEILEAVHEPSFWDIGDPPTNKATLDVSRGDGNHRPSSSNACKTPAAAAADDIRATPSQLDCSGCHILREVVHTNVHEPSFWDIGDPPTNKATLAVSGGDGNHRPSLSNACKAPLAAAEDIRATPSQLDCSGCHILREVVHTNVHEPSFWDIGDPPTNKATLAVSQGDGNHRLSLSNACETPAAAAAAAAEDICATPSQLDCSGCHILREVVHTNGLQNTKLAIHGGLGIFYHATVGVYDITRRFPSAIEEAYIDLSTQTFERVKQFLVDYGLLRMRDRYVLIEDSLSNFYDVLCVKLSDDIASTSTATPRLPEPGLCQSRPTAANDMDAIRIPKTGIAAQRERTGKLHLRDLTEYFHLPITEAAKELKICSTAIKKICRRDGMSRWPYRKIKSIDKMISSLLEDASKKTGQEVTHTLAEIEKLRAKRARLCAGFLS